MSVYSADAPCVDYVFIGTYVRISSVASVWYGVGFIAWSKADGSKSII